MAIKKIQAKINFERHHNKKKTMKYSFDIYASKSIKVHF